MRNKKQDQGHVSGEHQWAGKHSTRASTSRERTDPNGSVVIEDILESQAVKQIKKQRTKVNSRQRKQVNKEKTVEMQKNSIVEPDLGKESDKMKIMGIN